VTQRGMALGFQGRSLLGVDHHNATGARVFTGPFSHSGNTKMRGLSRLRAHVAHVATCAALALLALSAPAAATTSTSKLVTDLTGLAAKAVRTAANKTAHVTPVKLTSAEAFAYPSKLALEALRKGLTIKCGAGVGLCPMGHCCRCEQAERNGRLRAALARKEKEHTSVRARTHSASTSSLHLSSLHLSSLSPPPSQPGFCEVTPTACDGTCQLHYSGPGSPCSANLPTPLATVKWSGDGKLAPKIVGSLPPVPPDSVCGEFVGACPEAQCCSQFGFCVDEGSFFCHTAACVLAASPGSPGCAAAWGETKPLTRRLKLTATWGRASPDGVERDVILVNGKFPSPTIRGTVRDRVQVKKGGRGRRRGMGWDGMEGEKATLTVHLLSFFFLDRVCQPDERGERARERCSC